MSELEIVIVAIGAVAIVVVVIIGMILIAVAANAQTDSPSNQNPDDPINSTVNNCPNLAIATSSSDTPTGNNYNYIGTEYNSSSFGQIAATYQNAIGWVIYNRTCNSIVMTGSYVDGSLILLDPISSNENIIWSEVTLNGNNSPFYAGQTILITGSDSGIISNYSFVVPNCTNEIVIIDVSIIDGKVNASLSYCSSTTANITAPIPIQCVT